MNLAYSSLGGPLSFGGSNSFYYFLVGYRKQIFTSRLKLVFSHFFRTLCSFIFQVVFFFWDRSLEMNRLVEGGLDLESVGLDKALALPLTCVTLGKFLNLSQFVSSYVK